MIKRGFDITSSLLALIVLSPLFCCLSLMILLESKGGVFYLQERVGLHGLPFLLIKFRTMKKGADEKGLLTVGNRDPRITRLGYYLRKYKIDELPQLLNVLIGDMSIVGPRPEVQKYVALYTDQQREILAVRPGLTDYSSLYYVNENEQLDGVQNPELLYVQEIMPHKLMLAKQYVEEKSFLLDMKIIVKTILKICFR